MLYNRIISLTPSITETLFALGCGDQVVGVTDSCDFPSEANSRPHVCSWFNPDMERITALKPDLALGLSTAHARLGPQFQEMGIKFILYNPSSVLESFYDMEQLGSLLGLSSAARSQVHDLRLRMNKLTQKVQLIKPVERLTVSRILDVDGDNLIVAGPKSFQFDVITQAGGVNVTAGIDEAYPTVSFQSFKTWDPDVIFFCGSDPRYISRLQADQKWQALKGIRNGKIYQFDCGLTCRTGPRIVDMAELLFQTLYG